MKYIFNSLGSNYSLKFSILSLSQIFFPNKKEKEKTVELLGNFFGQKIESQNLLFTYKGRDAIELALKAYGIGKSDQVLTQAFSCFSIEEAIVRTGATPLYVDVAPEKINFNLESIKLAFEKSKNARAIIIQHSLGHPADFELIKKWAKENKIIVIEDLAQALGALNNQKRILGMDSDATILSFGRDKILDAVAGGAVIFNKKPHTSLSELKLRSVSFKIVLRDLTYPFLSLLIRSTYGIKLGKIIHFFLKNIKIIDNPIKSDYNFSCGLPINYFKLLNHQLENLSLNLHHRKKISMLYLKKLQEIPDLKIITQHDDVEKGSSLRFCFLANNPTEFLKKLKLRRIYLQDRWYRNAVDCGSLKCESFYQKNSCPNAESVASRIVNLPTHQGVSLADAIYIIEEINHVRI